MDLLSFLSGNSQVKKALRKGAVIVDLRTAHEFDKGKIPGSINIPVDRVGINFERIRNLKKPIIFCTSPGISSQAAIKMMKDKGLKEVYDGGNWERLLKVVNNI